MSLPKPAPSSAALVTGASTGIGAAISRELAAVKLPAIEWIMRRK